MEEVNKFPGAANSSLRFGPVGSQINYELSPLMDLIQEQVGTKALDMETASEAQMLAQLHVHFIAIRMISNGVYGNDGHRMEMEYAVNKLTVSQKGKATLSRILSFLAPDAPEGGTGVKTIGDLTTDTAKAAPWTLNHTLYFAKE